MNEHVTVRQPRMSPQAFAALGVAEIAFVKPVIVDGKTAHAVHSADGTPLAVVADRATAFAMVRQNDLEPVSAH
ncbi:MAG: DUF1150 family protein [Rhodospirillaceae bacterium]|nr:DUF1150 family protein [Rhodospirillaceae bacterium]